MRTRLWFRESWLHVSVCAHHYCCHVSIGPAQSVFCPWSYFLVRYQHTIDVSVRKHVMCAQNHTMDWRHDPLISYHWLGYILVVSAHYRHRPHSWLRVWLCHMPHMCVSLYAQLGICACDVFACSQSIRMSAYMCMPSVCHASLWYHLLPLLLRWLLCILVYILICCCCCRCHVRVLHVIRYLRLIRWVHHQIVQQIRLDNCSVILYGHMWQITYISREQVYEDSSTLQSLVTRQSSMQTCPTTVHK